MITVPVTCLAYDQQGNLVVGAVYTATLNRTEIYQGLIVPESVTATADSNGIAVLNLWPNALGVNASMYTVKAINPDTNKDFLKNVTILVPNSACNLHQIIVSEPYPALDASAQALAAAQGALALVTAQAGIATAKAVLTAADVVLTHADVVLTNADVVLTHADADQTALDRIATAADRVQTGLDAVATAADNVATDADAVQTALDAIATAADRVQTGLDKVAAAASAVTASNAADTATTQAGTATTQAGNAATSAGTASTQAGIATTQAGNAATSAGTATTQAGLATSNGAAQVALATAQSGIASTQAGIATTQANAAAASAGTATTQATTATTKASEALASANAAAASFDSFDDRFLGAKAVAPTLDNDGGALLTGALYWDTALGALRVWTGAAWTNTTELDDRVLADQQLLGGISYATDMALQAVREIIRAEAESDTAVAALTVTVGSYDTMLEQMLNQLAHLLDLAGVTARAIAGGDVQLRAGSAANPSLDAFGDIDTGLFFPAANTMAFATGGVERWRSDANGYHGFGTTTPTGVMDINDNKARIRTARTPASATAAGNAGEFCWDASYFYICTSTNVWRRTAHATW